MNTKTLLLAAVGAAILVYMATDAGRDEPAAPTPSDPTLQTPQPSLRDKAPFPENLRKCTDKEYTLRMEKFHVDKAIVTGNEVTTLAKFTPNASGTLETLRVSVFYRGLEIFDYEHTVQESFEAGKEYVFKYLRKIPTRIPRIAVRVILSFLAPDGAELSCAGFDLNYGSA